jgi:hypothetical protein
LWHLGWRWGSKRLLCYGLLWGSFLLRCVAHTVNKHTRHCASRGIKDAHLHGFGNLLLVAAVILSDLLRGLEVIRFGFHHYAPAKVL